MVEQQEFDFTKTYNKPWRLLSIDDLFDQVSTAAAVDADEDQRVERKIATYRARALGDYFSMWANTAPFGGIILIGVEDDGQISGCLGTPTAHLNDLQRAGDVYAPDARYHCRTVDVTNMRGEPDQIIAIRVLYREDRVVETQAGEAFDRRGG